MSPNAQQSTHFTPHSADLWHPLYVALVAWYDSFPCIFITTYGPPEWSLIAAAQGSTLLDKRAVRLYPEDFCSERTEGFVLGDWDKDWKWWRQWEGRDVNDVGGRCVVHVACVGVCCLWARWEETSGLPQHASTSSGSICPVCSVLHKLTTLYICFGLHC